MKLKNYNNYWIEVNLKDYIVEIESGKRPKGGAISEGVPSLGGEHIDSNGGFNIKCEKLKYVPREFYEKMKNGIIKLGDVLIVKDGATTGKVAYVNDEFPLKEACINEHVFLLRTKTELNSRYLSYYLRSSLGQNKIMNDFRGATVGGVSKKFIDFKMMLPTLEIQIKIVEVLEKVENTIEKRKKAIKLLDELVKSKFIEMFGDPFLNPKGWQIKELKEVILLANNGLARRGNDLDGNIVLRLVELQDGYLDYTSVNRIKLTESEEKRYWLKNGDFLFARVNGNPYNVGRCAYYKDIGEKVFHNDHIIRVRFDNSIINNCFVSTMLNSPYGKLQMKDKLKTSAGQYTVNQTGISEIKVVVPPIQIQNQFEDFVKEVGKLKFEMENSLKELENNFNSLMQRAFNGELF